MVTTGTGYMLRRFFAVGLLAVLAACDRESLPSEALMSEFTRSALPAKRPLKGTVSLPPGLVGLDSSSLIGLDGASLLGLDGASLKSSSASVRHLQSAADRSIAGVTVLLAQPDGRPVKPRTETKTDEMGRFAFSVRADRYVVVALLQDEQRRPVRLRGFGDARAPQAAVRVNLASTIVVAGLAAEGQQRGLEQMPFNAYEQVLVAAEAAVPKMAPLVAVSDENVLEGFRELLERDQAIFEAVETVRPVLQGPKEWFEALDKGEIPPTSSPDREMESDDDQDMVPETASAALPVVEGISQATASRLGNSAVPDRVGSGVLSGREAAQQEGNRAERDSASDDDDSEGAEENRRPPPAPSVGRPPSSRAPVTKTFQLPGDFAKEDGCFDWMKTGLKLKKGDTVRVRASGKINLWARFLREIGPEGHPSRRAWSTDKGCKFPMPDQPLGCLVARVDKQMECVGEKASFVVKKDGGLRFAVNDLWMKDNSGRFEVTVTVIPKEKSED